MTYFPQHAIPRPATPAAASPRPGRQAMLRDILWNQPVFKAPTLPNPRIALDPLPFTATRIARRAR